MYLWQLVGELKAAGKTETTVTVAQLENWQRLSKETADERDALVDWQNTITGHMPESYDGDEAQEAIIDRWLNDLVVAATVILAGARAGREWASAGNAAAAEVASRYQEIVALLQPVLEGPNDDD